MTREHLRDYAQRRRDDPDVIALLWEIRRMRETLVDVREYFDVIYQAWREEVGGKLVALERLKSLLGDEPAVIERKMGRGRRE